jgi:hypothetical protein
MHLWFLYRLAPIYQNKAYKFFYLTCSKIEHIAQDILPNRLLFLKHQFVPAILKNPNSAEHKTTLNRSFKLTAIILQKALPLTLNVI